MLLLLLLLLLLQYLQDLECPLPLTADNRQAVLQWMLSFAVSLEYADNGTQRQQLPLR
jgi:hypothetical protein